MQKNHAVAKTLRSLSFAQSATQEHREAVGRALWTRGAVVDAVDVRGFSALHRAAELGEAAIASLLLMHGADPDRVASGEPTPRSLARGGEHQALLAMMESRKP